MGKSFTVRQKLLFIAGLLALITAWSLFENFFGMGELRDQEKTFARFQRMEHEIKKVKDLNFSVLRVRYHISETINSAHEEADSFGEARQSYENALRLISEIQEMDKNKASHLKKLDAMRSDLEKIWGLASTAVHQAKGLPERKQEFEEFDKQCDALSQKLAEYAQGEDREGTEATEAIAQQTQKTYRTNLFTAIFISLFGIAAITMMILLIRSILRPLKYATEIAETVSKGDLRHDLENRRSDELGILMGSIQHVVLAMRKVINEIVSTSRDVVSTADTLRNGAKKTTEGVTRQNEQSAQIAAAAEELSQTITDIARNAAVASETSQEAMKTAEEGKGIAGGAIDTVNEVNTASSELAGMIGKLNERVGEIGDIVT
ncbi:MAG TPA: methyl-accepting chemotaxis protein, partial [Dissulfurispiraceae bacterium]